MTKRSDERSDAARARKTFTKTFTRTLPAIFMLGLLASAPAQAAEPEIPPPTTQPHQHSVDLREKITIRMGDTVTLKGTAFSAKLVGFQEPKCAVPGSNCGVSFNPEPIPQFQLREGTTVCEPGKPNSSDLTCLSLLAYAPVADRVTDRTAVKVQIQKKTEKQRLEEKHRSHKRNRK